MAKSLIPAVWELPTEIRNRLGERAGRQRCMEAEGHFTSGTPSSSATKRR